MSSDDEDGVTWYAMVPNQMSKVDVVVSGNNGKIDAWVDFNGDRDWLDPGEQIVISQPANNGFNSYPFTVPAAAVPGTTTYTRVRLSTIGGLSPGGPASDGEVEDYLVPIGKKIQAGIGIDRSTTPPSAVLNWTAETGAASYNVYSSTTLAGPFPSAWTLETSGITALTWSQTITGPRKFFIVVAFP